MKEFEELAEGQQSVEYTMITQEVAKHTLRVQIKSDSYDFQSYARIQRWDGQKWQPLASIHYSKMQTPFKLKYSRTVDVVRFKRDRDNLIKQARFILRAQ